VTSRSASSTRNGSIVADADAIPVGALQRVHAVSPGIVGQQSDAVAEPRTNVRGQLVELARCPAIEDDPIDVLSAHAPEGLHGSLVLDDRPLDTR
jgi:hypothetical protein